MARRGYSLLFASGLFLSDIIGTTLGFFLSFRLRFFYYTLIFFPAPSEIPSIGDYAKALPVIWMVVTLCFWAGGLYRESLSFKKIVRIGSIIKVVFYAVMILIALSAFYREISFSRLFILFLFPSFILFVSLGRWLLISLEMKIRKMQGKIRSLIVVGDGKVAYKLAHAFASHQSSDYITKGIIRITESENDKESGVPILGTLEQMEQILDLYQPDEVIFSTFNLDHGKLTEIITACDRRMIQFYLVPDVFNFLTSKVELTSVAGINLIGLQKFPLDNGLNRLTKRVTDILGSLTGLILLSWLFFILAILIKLTSKGPVFFHQTRCHEDGKEFLMFKFRTMKEDAEKQSGPVWANKEDQRCTSIGKIIRSINVDELPQLINVLKGDMSLVGPRPERPHFISKFKFDIPRYMARHSIKPGITGWAQVNGWRGNTSLEERIKYDLYYIENWSIWLDIKIIFLTFFSYKNAY